MSDQTDKSMRDLRSLANSPDVRVAELVKLDAEAIAKAMQIIHGGDWSVEINHHSQFVPVSRDWGRHHARD